MRLLVTGGAGFIGSTLVRHLIGRTEHEVLNLDKLTYAGTLSSLAEVAEHPRYRFLQANICDEAAVGAVLDQFRPERVAHLAAETHVDRSIDAPAAFVQTNVVGTSVLLAAAHRYWRALAGAARDAFRFVHVTTDEVYGALGETGFLTEDTPYNPRSPYAASKAGSDHLVSAWHTTYGLPALIVASSNNYGPYQFPEKLIPLTIGKAIDGETLPVYGDGRNVRDWLFVDDHVGALQRVIEAGHPGARYNVGGNCERRNIQVVEAICDVLDDLRPRPDRRSYRTQIGFVPDRPGHDYRYAIDASKIGRELGWTPSVTFAEGLERTVRWYLANESWWRPLQQRSGADRRVGLSSR